MFKPSKYKANVLDNKGNLINKKDIVPVWYYRNGRYEFRETTIIDKISNKEFEILDVKNETAQQAACQAEHALGPDIIARLLSFVEFVNNRNKNGYDIIKEFKKFCKKKIKADKK